MLSQTNIYGRPSIHAGPSSKVTKKRKNSKDHTLERNLSDMLEFAVEESTIHGPRHIWYNKKNWLGVLWLLIMAICAFLLVTVSGKYFYDFAQRSVSSQSGIEWSVQMRLPSLTICNKDFFSRKKLEALDIDPETYNVMMLVAGSPFTMKDDLLTNESSRSIIGQASGKISDIMLKFNFTFPQLIANVSYKCEELIEGCYLLLNYSSGDYCCRYLIPMRTMSGLCYTFFTQPNHVQRFTADFMGMTLYVKVPQDDKIVVLDNLVRRTSQVRRGIQLTPMSSTAHPNLLVIGLGVLVMPWTATSIEIHAVEIDREKEKVDYIDFQIDPCLPAEEVNYLEDKATFMSTETNCYASAIDKCTSEVCQCALYGIDSIYGKDLCSPLASLECFHIVNGFIRNVSNQTRPMQALAVCIVTHLATCRTICHETIFKYWTSYSFGNDFMSESPLPLLNISDTLAVVNMYFGRFDKDVIKFTREGLPEFLGKFGGQTGLLLGCSIISMVEFIIFVILICVACTRSVSRMLIRVRTAPVKPVEGIVLHQKAGL